jgi:hypothetical protein
MISDLIEHAQMIFSSMETMISYASSILSAQKMGKCYPNFSLTVSYLPLVSLVL